MWRSRFHDGRHTQCDALQCGITNQLGTNIIDNILLRARPKDDVEHNTINSFKMKVKWFSSCDDLEANYLIQLCEYVMPGAVTTVICSYAQFCSLLALPLITILLIITCWRSTSVTSTRNVGWSWMTLPVWSADLFHARSDAVLSLGNTHKKYLCRNAIRKVFFRQRTPLLWLSAR